MPCHFQLEGEILPMPFHIFCALAHWWSRKANHGRLVGCNWSSNLVDPTQNFCLALSRKLISWAGRPRAPPPLRQLPSLLRDWREEQSLEFPKLWTHLFLLLATTLRYELGLNQRKVGMKKKKKVSPPCCPESWLSTSPSPSSGSKSSAWLKSKTEYVAEHIIFTN